MYKENMNYENQQRMIFDMVNEFGIPEIQPTKYEQCEFIGFNQAKTEPGKACISFWMITNSKDYGTGQMLTSICFRSFDLSCRRILALILIFQKHYRFTTTSANTG
jgi:hypothetical protein